MQYRKQLVERMPKLTIRCDLLEKSYFCSIANNSHVRTEHINQSCDLLEKSYFCSIANNSENQSYQRYSVVICLKNRTFAVSQTTSKPR